MAKKIKQSKKKKNKVIRQNVIRVQGVFTGTGGGFGFVAPNDHSPDVFIPPKFVDRAIDGDIVEVEIFPPNPDYEHDPGKPSGPVGKIVGIVSRQKDVILAEVIDQHNARPMDRKLPENIKINSMPRGVKRGTWVKLRLLNDGSKHTETLRASVEAVGGKAGTIEGDLKAIEQEYKIVPAYTAAQEQAADKLVPRKIERSDLRNLFTITIDPADAHDFDDAVSIQQGEKTTEVLLGVHIADVAAWIAPGSKFDKEAQLRAFSCYIPGMFRPMLPKSLTQKISLKENRDSIAHSFLFTIRKRDGKITSVKRTHSVIRVQKRLTYESVQAYIENSKNKPADWSAELVKHIKLLISTVKKLRSVREKNEKFLNIETSEIRVIFDEDAKKIAGLERKQEGEADQLIEECMLTANSAAAKEILDKHIAGLFRIHPEPIPEKVDEFSSFVYSSFHLKTGDILSSRDNCRAFLDSIPDDHRKPIILSKFLRMLPRASYLENPELHYGLGKFLYSHFTSPIRRYTDLLIHQQFFSMDSNVKLRSKNSLSSLAEYCSKKEELNDNAYFAASDRMKLHYLKQCSADDTAKMYEAVICKVNSQGLVCDIPELGLYGFVPMEKLRGGRYRKNIKGKIKADYGHFEYKVGDFIYLILDSLDTVRGSAIFRPAI